MQTDEIIYKDNKITRTVCDVITAAASVFELDPTTHLPSLISASPTVAPGFIQHFITGGGGVSKNQGVSHTDIPVTYLLTNFTT